MWSQLEVKSSGWEITQIFALLKKSVLHMLCCDALVRNLEKCGGHIAQVTVGGAGGSVSFHTHS